MTKHNLREHLDWLLCAKPFTTPSFPLPIDQSSDFQSGTETSFEPAFQESLVSIINSTESLEGNVANTNRGDVNLVPPKPSRGPAPPEDMARLQSGPKSTQKLRFLAQTSPDPPQVPTPRTHQSSRQSLADRHSADCGTRVEGLHSIPTSIFGTLIDLW